MTLAAVTLLGAEETGSHLPVSPWLIGGGAFVLLVLLLAVTLSFGKDR